MARHFSLPVTSEYLERIRSGRKTTTIRTSCRLSAGDGIGFTNYRDYLRARCIGVDLRLMHELSEDDARADGFEDLKALRVALKTHYPTLRASSRVWIIRFELLTDSPHIDRASVASE